MRYYIFIDESGEANINRADPRFNIFVLCGILFREDHYQDFDEKMKLLKKKYFGNDEIIFHSIQMRKRTDAFKIFQDNAIQQEFYKDIGEIFTGCEYSIISCVVNKEEYKATYPFKNQAYEDSLKFLCERAVYYIRQRDQNYSVHLCLEKRQKNKDTYLKKYYTKFKRYGTEYVGTYEFSRFDRLLHFRDKKANTNGLQFADLCAYPIARTFLTPEVTQPTFEVFKPKILRGRSGQMKGYGIKHFP